MTSAGQKLLEAALELPEDERVALAERLLASVDDAPEADQELLAEIGRRVAAYRSGAERAYSHEEVREAVFKRLKAR